MTIEMILLNVCLLILLTFLIENGLRKTLEVKCRHVTRVYWFYLLPTYILAVIITVLLLFPATYGSSELLLNFQKYAIGAHVLACLLFIGAFDGAKTINKAMRKRTLSRQL